MSLSAAQLGKDILAAFKGALSEKWPDIKEYGEAEAKKLAQTLVMIATLLAIASIVDRLSRRGSRRRSP